MPCFDNSLGKPYTFRMEIRVIGGVEKRWDEKAEEEDGGETVEGI